LDCWIKLYLHISSKFDTTIPNLYSHSKYFNCPVSATLLATEGCPNPDKDKYFELFTLYLKGDTRSIVYTFSSMTASYCNFRPVKNDFFSLILIKFSVRTNGIRSID
jgi:hypothetical protein